jgi:hypothetical protein
MLEQDHWQYTSKDSDSVKLSQLDMGPTHHTLIDSDSVSRCKSVHPWFNGATASIMITQSVCVKFVIPVVLFTGTVNPRSMASFAMDFHHGI